MNPNKGGRKYAMKGKKDKDVYFQAITMIYQATGWKEIHSVPEVRADLDTNQVEPCLIRYPFSTKIIVDGAKDLLVEFNIMMANDYRIIRNSISVRNPQVITIMERVHQTICNIIQIYLQNPPNGFR